MIISGNRKAAAGRLAAVAFLAAALAGCAALRGTDREPAPPPKPKPPPVNLSGYSAAFKEGYADGCASARGGQRRDEGRFKSDGDYMMGWNDGRSVCARR